MEAPPPPPRKSRHRSRSRKRNRKRNRNRSRSALIADGPPEDVEVRAPPADVEEEDADDFQIEAPPPKRRHRRRRRRPKKDRAPQKTVQGDDEAVVVSSHTGPGPGDDPDSGPMGVAVGVPVVAVGIPVVAVSVPEVAVSVPVVAGSQTDLPSSWKCTFSSILPECLQLREAEEERLRLMRDLARAEFELAEGGHDVSEAQIADLEARIEVADENFLALKNELLKLVNILDNRVISIETAHQVRALNYVINMFSNQRRFKVRLTNSSRNFDPDGIARVGNECHIPLPPQGQVMELQVNVRHSGTSVNGKGQQGASTSVAVLSKGTSICGKGKPGASSSVASSSVASTSVASTSVAVHSISVASTSVASTSVAVHSGGNIPSERAGFKAIVLLCDQKRDLEITLLSCERMLYELKLKAVGAKDDPSLVEEAIHNYTNKASELELKIESLNSDIEDRISELQKAKKDRLYVIKTPYELRALGVVIKQLEEGETIRYKLSLAALKREGKVLGEVGAEFNLFLPESEKDEVRCKKKDGRLEVIPKI